MGELLSPEEREEIVLTCANMREVAEASAKAQLAHTKKLEEDCLVCQGRGKSMSDKPDRTGCLYMAVCPTCQVLRSNR